MIVCNKFKNRKSLQLSYEGREFKYDISLKSKIYCMYCHMCSGLGNKVAIDIHSQHTFRKVASLEALGGFFRLPMKGIFDPYVL